MAKELGVEIFLLDDGWFGDKYPRDDDRSSRGHWSVDRKKLPDGLTPSSIRRSDAASASASGWSRR